MTLRNSCSIKRNTSMGGGVFSEVGLMLVEGRTPDLASARGHREGPHVTPLQPQVSGHACTEGAFLCERAAALRRHLTLLSDNSAPMTIDVLLSPDCPCGASRSSSVNICCLASSEDLLIEQWTVSILTAKPGLKTAQVTEKFLLQAIRSQLHFSQLSAWYSLGKVKNITYRLSHPVGCPEFSRPPLHHEFPVAPISAGSYIKVSVKSLPRLDCMPMVACPLHSTPSPLAPAVTVAKSVSPELGQCLLDPPARLPPPALKQGFTMWRDTKTNSPTKSRLKQARSPTKIRSHLVPGLVDDRMQSGCKHIGKHHCEDDTEERCSPPHSLHHYHPHPYHHMQGEKGCLNSEKNLCSDFDPTSREHFHNEFHTERCEVVNHVSIPNCGGGRPVKGGGSGLLLLRPGSSNPLKRKRTELESASKRLLFSRREAAAELAEFFDRLEITENKTQKILIKPSNSKPFVKPSPFRHIPSPIPQRKITWVTDSSSEETECESPKGGTPPIRPISAVAPRVPPTRPALPLLGSFEESVLKGRLSPVARIEGFTADLGASGAFCPHHLKLPVQLSIYSTSPYSTPFMGEAKLCKRGYRVPRVGTIQVTLMNPLGTVIKMFVVGYDLSEMPDNSLTFVRQRAWAPGNTLLSLVNLRFSSSKSGRVSLHSDIKMLISRQYDLESSASPDLASPDRHSLRSETVQAPFSSKPFSTKSRS